MTLDDIIRTTEVASAAVTQLAEQSQELPLAYTVETLNTAFERALEEFGEDEAPVVPLPPVCRVDAELPASCWEPEDLHHTSRCRALLLEIALRAAHDYVLYRSHKRLDRAQLAEDAYIWLFEEDRDHHWHRQREVSGKTITSFHVICDVLDLDPDRFRERVLQMNPRSVVTRGRPAERRRVRPQPDCGPTALELMDVRVEDLDSSGVEASAVEQHFEIDTPHTIYER